MISTVKKKVTTLLSLIGLFSQPVVIQAQLDIGIPGHRNPYSFADDAQEASGILVEQIRAVCKKIDDECVFNFDDFFGNLEFLQQQKIQAVLVIDTAILVDTDNILLSEPLCQAEFFVIQPMGNKEAGNKVSLKGVSIGVAYESQFHLHLLDQFYSISSIKPYGILESAIFDMKTNRLGAVALEGAFFYGRVVGKNIFSPSIAAPENRLAIDSKTLKRNSMRLAVKKDNEALLKRLNGGLRQLGPTPLCKELLKDGEIIKE